MKKTGSYVCGHNEPCHIQTKKQDCRGTFLLHVTNLRNICVSMPQNVMIDCLCFSGVELSIPNVKDFTGKLYTSQSIFLVFAVEISIVWIKRSYSIKMNI